MAKRRRHNFVSDAGADALVCQRIARAFQAGFQSNYSAEVRKCIREADGNLFAARNAVGNAIKTPTILLHRWLSRANGRDQFLVTVAEVKNLISLIRAVGLVPQLGTPETV
jgi:hypothetical protein